MKISVRFILAAIDLGWGFSCQNLVRKTYAHLFKDYSVEWLWCRCEYFYSHTLHEQTSFNVQLIEMHACLHIFPRRCYSFCPNTTKAELERVLDRLVSEVISTLEWDTERIFYASYFGLISFLGITGELQRSKYSQSAI